MVTPRRALSAEAERIAANTPERSSPASATVCASDATERAIIPEERVVLRTATASPREASASRLPRVNRWHRDVLARKRRDLLWPWRRSAPAISRVRAPGEERHGGGARATTACRGFLSNAIGVRTVNEEKRNDVFVSVCGREYRKIGCSSSVQVVRRGTEPSSASQQYECVPSLTTAKARRNSPKNLLARSLEIHTSAWMLEQNVFLPVEKACITAGKGGRLQWEWCDLRRTHFLPGFRYERRARVCGWGAAFLLPARTL
jgi:hypothetical protein